MFTFIGQRCIDAYQAGEGGHLKLSRRFSVAICSVRRWIANYKVNQSILPKPHGGGLPPKILSEELSQLKELV